jgi:predicted transcriptional regulator of viral defense system
VGAVDAIIAAFAARQHGVVSQRQLAAAGVSWEAVRHRVKTGRLTRLHRGVYRVGPTHTALTSPMAAVLACGPTAALSHHAAAALHGITRPRAGPIDVTVRSGQPRSRAGIRVHRATVEVVTVQGIPVTTVARTLRDLAAELSQRDLQRAVEEAQIQRKLDHASLARAVDRAAGHRGARALRATTSDVAMTRSEAERRLVELIRRAGLPEPQTNKRIGGWEVDAVWPAEGLALEVDGFAFHSTREAFERDRLKHADLAAAGWRVSRVTWRQLVDEREAVVARLTRALSGPRGSGRPPAAAGPPGFPRDPQRR